MNSPKTIIEELNLKKYDRKLVLNKPEDLDELNRLIQIKPNIIPLKHITYKFS